MADQTESPFWTARKLLRAARVGTLATVAEGQPFASLVTPACAPDLSILMLLSGLSEHTRHLKADPRASLLVAGAAVELNPQTTPRLTITGLAEQISDPALRARWLAVHPYGALYADFADFGLWRIQPAGALLVAGFGRAFRPKLAELMPDPAAVAALAEAEAAIRDHCNQDHQDDLAAIARGAGGAASTWRMVAADTDGCDLAPVDAEGAVLRVAWSAPVTDASGVRNELVTLAQAARAVAVT